jgi:hypothetical protein
VLIPEDHGNGILLDLEQLKKPTVAIIHLATQPPGTLQQVTLRPDKVSKGGFIYLGDTPNDQAMCWVHPNNVMVMEILGMAQAPQAVDGPTDGKPWMCVPFPETDQVQEAAA